MSLSPSEEQLDLLFDSAVVLPSSIQSSEEHLGINQHGSYLGSPDIYLFLRDQYWERAQHWLQKSHRMHAFSKQSSAQHHG